MSNTLAEARETPFAAKIETRIISAFVWSLAAWTVLIHIAVATGASFNRVVQLAPVTVLVAAVGWFICNARPVKDAEENLGSLPPSKPWLIAAALVMLTFCFSYLLFRITAMLFVLAAWVWLAFRESSSGAASVAITAVKRDRYRDLLGLTGLCLLGVLATLCLHRPSNDDGFYVSVTADALRHPERAIWSTDTIHDDLRLPVILPIYKTESNEHLAALAARLLHVSALRAAHTVLPVPFAIFCVLAWAMVAQTINPRNWLAVTAVAAVISLLDGSGVTSPGNFAFVHLQEGKAVLTSAMVPILCVYSWRFISHGQWRDGLMLLAAQIASVGLSSTGILIAPMVVFEIGLFCAPVRRSSILRLAVMAMTCLYPLGLGALLRGKMMAVTWVAQYEMQTPISVLNRLFGTSQAFLYFAALIFAWKLVPRSTARLVLAPAIMLLVFIINPALTTTMEYKVFSPLTYWRGFWVVPWLVLTGSFVCAAGKLVYDAIHARRPHLATAGTILFCLVLLFGTMQWHPVWRHKKNGVTFHLAGLSVDEPEYAVARRLVELTPANSSALAPETVACWTAALDQRPPLIFVRSFYTQSVLGQDDVDARNRLGEIVDRQHINAGDVTELVAGLHRYMPGAIVLRKTAGAEVAQALRGSGYKSEAVGNYVIWFLGPGHREGT